MITIQVKLKKALWEFDKKKVKNIVIGIFLVMTIMFVILYLFGRSPFNYVLKSSPNQVPIYLFSIYGPNEKENMAKPMGVAINGNRVYVTNSTKGNVQIYDYNGTYYTTFGKKGKGKGELEFPYGIAVDSNGKVYIGDIGNNRIAVYDKVGNFLNYFGNSLDIGKPAGLFIDGDKLYVADIAKHVINIFALNGKKLKTLGKKGTKIGELISPNAVVFHEGKIYVSDTGNARIQVFNQLGNFIRSIGNMQTLSNPRGMAIDKRGVLYLVNNLVHQINGYDEEGKKVFSFGSMGTGNNQFFLPNGIAIDDSGRIYITDTINRRINVYQY